MTRECTFRLSQKEVIDALDEYVKNVSGIVPTDASLTETSINGIVDGFSAVVTFTWEK